MENQAYISHVHLKGYKSIRDMEVDLLPGLNIIIGPNGSGKTNFVDFMTFLNRYGYENQLYQKEFSVELIQNNIEKGKTINFESNSPCFVWIDQKIVIKGNGYSDKRNGKYLFNVESNIKSTDSIFDSTLKYTYKGSKFDLSIEKSGNTIEHQILSGKKISFTNPLNFINPNSSIELIHGEPQYDDAHPEYGVHYPNTIVKSAFDDIETKQSIKLEGVIRLLIYLWDKTEIDIENEQFINEFFMNLPLYSPISKVDLDKRMVVSQIQGNEEKLSNLLNALKFYVNGNWWTWDDLSDGTKRLFYIICEVTSYNELVFVDEPELGIHPNQLSRLMDFLKEQSSEKQIIITTHSPQVLNELSEDELDRIIVTRHEGERGTQMYHLSEEEKGFAKGYMENGAFLSDYWVQSGFMKEEEIV